MLLFKKIKKGNHAADEMQLQISSKWKTAKEKIANYLQRKSESLSARAKKYSLIFFCLLFGGTSIAITIHSATTKAQPVSITNISKPAHSIQNENLYLHRDSSITKQEFNRVEQFKQYLFQLQINSSGKKKFDSIIQARPQLIDSINLFEKIYLQQK